MLLVHVTGQDQAPWAAAFAETLAPYPVVQHGDGHDPAEVDYIFAWKPGPDAFEGLGNLKAVLSMGAGVDALMQHPRLPAAPVVRFVADDLSQRMSDYVVAQVTMHQRLFTAFRAAQRAHRWEQIKPPLARDVTVGIMGMGELGQRAAQSLGPLGFALRGWSRSRKSIDGVTSFAGPDGFDAFLGGTDILVNLLPLTPDTAGILNRTTFGKLRRGVLPGGPVVINAARGKHQREADLVDALRDGTLGAAGLDVFETEPLPADSPLWDIENCYITPHISAVSDIRSCVDYFTRIIQAHEGGGALPHVVDRARGY